MYRSYEYHSSNYYNIEHQQYEYHGPGGNSISSTDDYFQRLTKMPTMPIAMIAEFPHFPGFDNHVLNINPAYEEGFKNNHPKRTSHIDHQKIIPRTNHHHQPPPMVHRHEKTAKNGKRDGHYNRDINVDMEADRFIMQKRRNFTY